MNLTLLEHWEKHGLVIIGKEYTGWYWSHHADKLGPEVLEQLERFEAGSLVLISMHRLMREAGFDPLTCMLTDKKVDSRIFTMDDFKNMAEPELFGFFAVCGLDDVKLPNPEHYRRVYHNFSVLRHQDGLKGIRKHLAAQRMYKP